MEMMRAEEMDRRMAATKAAHSDGWTVEQTVARMGILKGGLTAELWAVLSEIQTVGWLVGMMADQPAAP